MCNPRRVRVTATRVLAERWEREVERQVTLTGEAAGEARIREPLAAQIGAPTLAALDRALARAEGWERRGEVFVHDLPDGYVLYHPADRELEIVARLSETVVAEASAAVTVSGGIDEVVERVGVGVHYDDDWGGVTEQDARNNAERIAATGADAEAGRRLAEARGAFDVRAREAAEAAALDRAREVLAEDTARRGGELEQAARRRLTAIGVQGRGLFHVVLAQAYRDAILAYARTHRAEALSWSDEDGVIDIEFEIPA